MLLMDVIDLRQWLRDHGEDPDTGDDVLRLERAIHRLDEVSAAAAERGARLEPTVQTEMLAILGALNIGMVGEAARRAERLSDRLARQRRAAGPGSL